MPDYLLYKLTWDESKQKYQKKPCNIDGSPLLEHQAPPRVSYDVAAAAVRPGYALGMWIDPPMFFIDVDNCVENGQLSPDASRLLQPFIAAGCYFEASTGGKGAHIIGTYTGELPAHSNRRPAVHTYEFYARDRGVVLNPAACQGSMHQDATAQLLAALASDFPPRNEGTLFDTSARRAEWRGPEDDDDELIRRALTARGSARQVFGTTATFAQLWSGAVEHNNESDMALASHLAFWTGCDVPRIERIMRRSGLMRDKWNTHRTYLRELTIERACATTQNVYQEPQRRDVVGELLGASAAPALPQPAAIQSDTALVDYHQVVGVTIDTINNTGTFRELTDTVMPSLGALALPRIHAERVVSALMARLKIFNSNMPIGLVRQIVTPPTVNDPATFNPPAWFAGFCYIKSSDKFYNTVTGSLYSAEAFRVEYSRFMPLKQSGSREDPVAWARDHWQVVTVDDLKYRPDQEPFFRFAGREYANSFNPNTMPPLTTASPHALACIEHFKSHLYLICSKRDWLYFLMLQWLAYNVQKPGHKIRWAPLIKGVGGDGKSIFGELMFATLGDANVKITSPSTLTNSGGFTDWATDACVNVIEEIRLEGKQKKQLYNAMKLIIGDRRQDLNRKGKPSAGTEINVTNTIANSNYADAAPLDDTDRRWLIIFSPYENIEDAVRDKGFSTTSELVAHFKMLGDSMRSEPGAWRAWLMGIDTSSFAPDDRAALTPERDSMRLASSDSLDQTVMDIITTGGFGITATAFASDCVSGRVEVAGERPRSQGWNALLTRLGYIQHHKPMWWGGKTRRIWTKRAMTDEKLKEILDGTTQPAKL